MSESEYKVADAPGKFLQAVKDGRKLQDAAWTNGRIILSNKRLILASNSGKHTLPFSKIASLSGRYVVNQTVSRVSEYISISLENEAVILISVGEDTETFELKLYGTLLDQREMMVRHPAVKGGVVQETSYEQARIKVDEEQLNVAMANGRFVPVDLDDVGSVEANPQEVDGETKPVLDIEHTQEEASVHTYFAGDSHTCAVLESLFKKGAQKSQASVEFSQTEKRVLMALYSGVSSFEIPDFLGMAVDDVEEIFERLIEVDVLEEVRQRREVSLKTHGRNIASEAINEE